MDTAPISRCFARLYRCRDHRDDLVGIAVHDLRFPLPSAEAVVGARYGCRDGQSFDFATSRRAKPADFVVHERIQRALEHDTATFPVFGEGLQRFVPRRDGNRRGDRSNNATTTKRRRVLVTDISPACSDGRVSPSVAAIAMPSNVFAFARGFWAAQLLTLKFVDLERKSSSRRQRALLLQRDGCYDLRTDARWFKSFGPQRSEQFRVAQGVSFDVGKR